MTDMLIAFVKKYRPLLSWEDRAVLQRRFASCGPQQLNEYDIADTRAAEDEVEMRLLVGWPSTATAPPQVLATYLRPSFYPSFVAKHYGFDHEPIQITLAVVDALPHISAGCDSPHGKSAFLAECFLCEVAADRGCQQMVMDEGDDEIVRYPRMCDGGPEAHELPTESAELGRCCLDKTSSGNPLNAPLNTMTNITWAGYVNSAIQEQVRARASSRHQRARSQFPIRLPNRIPRS